MKNKQKISEVPEAVESVLRNEKNGGNDVENIGFKLGVK